MRPAKTVAQHKTEGTFRKDRHPGPTLPLEVPPMPPDLSPAAQACWNIVAENVRFSGVVARVDGNALRLLCESWAIYLDATDAIRRDGITIGKTERTRMHPAVQVRAQAQKDITGLLRQFGLTPASRTTLRPGNAGKSQSEEERVANILKMRGAG